MKKYLFVLVCALLLLVTGCGNKNQVKCTGKDESTGMEAQIVADFDDNSKLVDASVVYDVKDKDTVEQYCSLFKLMENTDKGVSVSCSGTKITIKGFAKMEADEDEEDSMIGKTKEEFIKAMEEEKFTCK